MKKNERHRLPTRPPQLMATNAPRRDVENATRPLIAELPRQVVTLLGRANGRLDVIRRSARLADNLDAGLTVLLHDARRSSFPARDHLRKTTAQAEFWRERPSDTGTRGELVTGRFAPSVQSWMAELSLTPRAIVVDRRDVLRKGIGPEPFAQLLAGSEVPVLVVRPHGPKTYRRVILAVDGSDASARAVRVARALGVLDHAEVTIVHAFFAHAKAKLAYVGANRARIARHVATMSLAAARELAVFLDRENLADPDWDIVLDDGDAATVVLKAAARIHADLVVVGASSERRAWPALRERLASTMLRGARCDVLAVPGAPRSRGAGRRIGPSRRTAPHGRRLAIAGGSTAV